MPKIYLLSGPNPKIGFSEEIKKMLKDDLEGKKNLVLLDIIPKMKIILKQYSMMPLV